MQHELAELKIRKELIFHFGFLTARWEAILELLDSSEKIKKWEIVQSILTVETETGRYTYTLADPQNIEGFLYGLGIYKAAKVEG